MQIKNVFIATKCVVISQNYECGSVSTYFEEVEKILVYKQNNMFTNIINEELVQTEYEFLEIGQFFINLEQFELKPFIQFVNEAEKIIGKKIKLKEDMTRKQLLRLLIKINNDIKLKEEEKNNKKKMFKLV